jgi:LAO/AO transport system kinase
VRRDPRCEERVSDLAEAVVARDRAAVARALNLTEDRRPEARREVAELLAALRKAGALERAQRVGITGPPGVGKSTLVAALSRGMRADGVTVGVLAVDPSSVRSGGALLGDRTRIAPDPADHGLFVRSLSTAGELGGLARSVPLGVLVLAAAYDVVVVETVGVGQTETDVRHVVDTVVFVVQPGSGDVLQFLKAGIMEVPDVLVVNKADRADLARRAESELRAALHTLLAAGVGEARATPIILASARDGTGVDDLRAAIAKHKDQTDRAGETAARRRASAIAWGIRDFVRRHGEAGVERVGGEGPLADAVARAIDAGEVVPELVDRLGA